MKNRLADFIINKRALVLVVFLCATALFLYGARGLTFKMQDAGLQPAGYPNIKLNKEFREKFGGKNQLYILVQVRDKEDGGAYDDIFNYETLSTVKNIDTDLQNQELFPDIDRNKMFTLASAKVKDISITSAGMSLRSLMWPKVPTTKEDIEKLRIGVYQSFAYPALVSFDSKKTILMADFLKDRKIDYADVFQKLKDLRQKYENDNLIIAIYGAPVEHGYVESFIPKVFRFVCIALFAMMVIVLLCFRSVQAAVIAGLAGVVSAVWGLGLLGFLRFNLDPAVFGLPFFISLIAFLNAVFFIKRFSGAMTPSGDALQAAKTAIRELCGPCAATMLVAGILLLLASLAPFPAMRPLFLSCIFWAFASFAVAAGLVPVLLTWLPVKAKKADEATLLGRFMHGSARWVCGWGKYAVLVLVILATAWGCTYMNKLTLGNALPGSKLLWPWHRYNIDAFRIAFSHGVLSPLLIVAQGDKPESISGNTEFMRDAIELSRYLGRTPSKGPVPAVLTTLSAFTTVTGRLRGTRENDPNWNFVPTKDGQLAMIYRTIVAMAAPGSMEKFIDTEETATCIYVLCGDTTQNTIQAVMDRFRDYITTKSKFGIRHSDMQHAGLDKFIRTLDSFITKPEPLLPEKPPVDGMPHVYYRIGGGPIGIQADINDCLSLYFFWTLIFACIAVIAVIGLRCGSLLCGLFALLPLLCGGALAFVRMVTAKPQPLGLTPEVLPFVLIGFSLFAGGVIYLLNRIALSYAASKSWEQAIADAMCSTGKAVFYTGMICLVGFMPLMIPFTMHIMPFAVLSSVLIVMALCCMIATLYAVPAFVALFKPKSIARGAE